MWRSSKQNLFPLTKKMGRTFVWLFQLGIMQNKVHRDENSKITVQTMKDFLLSLKVVFSRSSGKQQNAIDSVKTVETTLSTQLPPKRYNGLMNLMRLFCNPDAPTEEIEKSLVKYNLTHKIIKWKLYSKWSMGTFKWFHTWLYNIFRATTTELNQVKQSDNVIRQIQEYTNQYLLLFKKILWTQSFLKQINFCCCCFKQKWE